MSVVEPFPDLLPEGDRAVLELEALLDDTLAMFRRYVSLSEAQHVVCTLWVAAAHAVDATSTTPYLHITSAEPESGKSRALEVLETLVPRPMFAASMTAAVLYRAVDKLSPTLLLDEVDNQLKDKTVKAELVGLLNAGYRRGVKAYRIGGSQRDQLESFETFCPKAIAGLDDLVAPLASRCLRIEMRRRRASEPVEDFFREDVLTIADPIRERFLRWAEGAVDELRSARPERIGVRDRLEEAVRLLLAIADSAAGSAWPDRARRALREVAGASTDGAVTERTQLLSDLRDVFESSGNPSELPTANVLEHLLEIEDAPWRGWWGIERDGAVHPEKGAPRKLARMLRPLGVKPRDVGDRTHRRKGYVLADLQDPFSRYLTAHPGLDPRTARTPLEQAENDGSLSAHGTPLCAEAEEPQTRMDPEGARSARIQQGSAGRA